MMMNEIEVEEQSITPQYRDEVSQKIINGQDEKILIEYFKNSSQEINARDSNNKIPLDHAIAYQKIQLTAYLIKNTALDDDQRRTYLTSYIKLLINRIQRATVADQKYLIAHFEENLDHLNLADRNKNTMLHHAVNYKKIALVTFFIEQPTILNVQNGEGKTPLALLATGEYYASVRGLFKTFLSTIQQNMLPDEKEKLEGSLIVAVKDNKSLQVTRLLELGAGTKNTLHRVIESSNSQNIIINNLEIIKINIYVNLLKFLEHYILEQDKL